MEKQKEENIFLNLVVNEENPMSAFRENIGLLRTYYGWSVAKLAIIANIPEATLQNIVKGKTYDCSLSVISSLAKAFNVSIDELAGTNTLSEETRKTIAMTRVLDNHVKKVIRVYAKHQYVLHKKNNSTPKKISVISPKCVDRRLKRVSLMDDIVPLDKLTMGTQEKISMGIKIPCDHYEPHFLKDEIVLLGFDREGENNEMCVVSSGGYIYICIKKIEFIDGKKDINYISITNKKKIFSYNEIDDRFGYVVGFMHPDGTWGER